MGGNDGEAVGIWDRVGDPLGKSVGDAVGTICCGASVGISVGRGVLGAGVSMAGFVVMGAGVMGTMGASVCFGAFVMGDIVGVPSLAGAGSSTPAGDIVWPNASDGRLMAVIVSSSAAIVGILLSLRVWQ